METKIIIPRGLCSEEAIAFVARRYATTPERVLRRYLVQEGIISPDNDAEPDDYTLAPNELALLRDLGVRPSAVEIN